MYPKLILPEFNVTNIISNGLNLHYYSKQTGLQGFVYELITGLGKIFKVSVEVLLINSKENNFNHIIFKIRW